MPLFSVITVTHQNLEGLRKTAASVNAQTCTDFEWIIIDGSSTDGTREFLKNTNANWISEPDQGIYDAMNKGIARATGDYLIFMNAGDQFAAPETLAHISHAIKTAREPQHFIYGDALEEQPNGAQILKPARAHPKWEYGMFTHHQAMVYNRNIINENRLTYDTAYPIAADYKLTIQLIQKSGFIYRLEYIPLCIFEQGGISQTRVRQGRIEQFKIRKELNLSPLWKNMMIYGLQTGTYQLRKMCPRLYWFFKSRRA